MEELSLKTKAIVAVAFVVVSAFMICALTCLLFVLAWLFSVPISFIASVKAATGCFILFFLFLVWNEYQS